MVTQAQLEEQLASLTPTDNSELVKQLEQQQVTMQQLSDAQEGYLTQADLEKLSVLATNLEQLVQQQDSKIVGLGQMVTQAQLKEQLASLTPTDNSELVKQLEQQQATIQQLSNAQEGYLTQADLNIQLQETVSPAKLQEAINSALARELPGLIENKLTELNVQYDSTIKDEVVADKIKKDPELGLVISRNDERKDYKQTLYFGKFTASPEHNFEIILSYPGNSPEFFIGLCDTSAEIKDETFYSKYAFLCEFFKKGTFYASYGKGVLSRRGGDHENLTISSGEYAKLILGRGGKNNQIITLKEGVLQSSNPFDAIWETEQKVEWSLDFANVKIPESLTGAIAIREGEFNILASRISPHN